MASGGSKTGCSHVLPKTIGFVIPRATITWSNDKDDLTVPRPHFGSTASPNLFAAQVIAVSAIPSALLGSGPFGLWTVPAVRIRFKTYKTGPRQVQSRAIPTQRVGKHGENEKQFSFYNLSQLATIRWAHCAIVWPSMRRMTRMMVTKSFWTGPDMIPEILVEHDGFWTSYIKPCSFWNYHGVSALPSGHLTWDGRSPSKNLQPHGLS